MEEASFDSSHATTRDSVKCNPSAPDAIHSDSNVMPAKMVEFVDTCVPSSSVSRIVVSGGDGLSDKDGKLVVPVTIISAQSYRK